MLPPSDQVVCGEVGGVVRGSHHDETAVGAQVVDAVGDGDAVGLVAEVVVVDGVRGFPQPRPGFFKLPTSSRFFGIALVTLRLSLKLSDRQPSGARRADDCATVLGGHKAAAAAFSFASGLPGGWWAAGAIPADIVQFNGHALQVAQKLAYLYGWPSMLDEDGNMDDATAYLLALFFAVMFGAKGAGKAISQLSGMIAKGIIGSSRSGFIKQTLRHLVGAQAAQISKAGFARGLAKFVPVIGGIFSGGITLLLFENMCSRLKDT